MPDQPTFRYLCRWIRKKVEIPNHVAQESRDEEIRCLRVQIGEMERHIEELQGMPLTTSTFDYVPVYPGQEGYEQADQEFDPKSFKGTWKFVSATPV